MPDERVAVPDERVAVPDERVAVPDERVAVPDERVDVPRVAVAVVAARERPSLRRADVAAWRPLSAERREPVAAA